MSVVLCVIIVFVAIWFSISIESFIPILIAFIGIPIFFSINASKQIRQEDKYQSEMEQLEQLQSQIRMENLLRQVDEEIENDLADLNIDDED